MALFTNIKQLPPDPILNLGQQFHADDNPDKVNLSVGVYLDTESHTPVMAAVKQAEQLLFKQQQSKVYIPQQGEPGFLNTICSLVLGDSDDLQSLIDYRLSVIATPGGCGALRIGAEVIHTGNPNATVWLSTPSWANHLPIISSCGLNYNQYPYYDKQSGEVNFDAMLECLSKLPTGDIVLLHACCHNPTGAELSQTQWAQVIDLCKRNGLIPFLDMAYQGLGNNLDLDAYAVRLAFAELDEVILAVSCSKNFGLYRERTGALFFLTKDNDTLKATISNALNNARKSYSMAPAHGSGIVATILESSELTQLWRTELQQMQQRINLSRKLLTEALHQKQTKRNFEYLMNNRGMFSFLNISVAQAQQLRKKYAIYLLDSSRINIVGINQTNVDYCANAITNVLDCE